MCSDADFDKEISAELLKEITDVDQEFLDSKYKAKSTLLCRDTSPSAFRRD